MVAKASLGFVITVVGISVISLLDGAGVVVLDVDESEEVLGGGGAVPVWQKKLARTASVSALIQPP